MKISVIGTGYVGLVTGTCLAETGNEVLCVDIDKDKVERMQSGEVPIYEPHLDILFERNIKANRLKFSTSLKEGLEHGDILFLALPTPEDEDGSADLKYILGVANEIGNLITQYKVIVDKSTVPVGTSEKVKAAIEKKASVDFDVVSNPEFLREGSAIRDTLYPDRIVIGAPSQHVAMTLLELYASLERPMIITDVHSAEMITNGNFETKTSSGIALSWRDNSSWADVGVEYSQVMNVGQKGYAQKIVCKRFHRGAVQFVQSGIKLEATEH